MELHSIILKKREKAEEAEHGKYRAITYEYVRPGAAAITELAPGNVFYVEGRRVRVDQIGLGVSGTETWHFCDACSHMEPATEESALRAECPACASTNWRDASLRRDLVRLRQVIATTFDRSSRSHDEKDEREFEFFKKHESVVIPADAVRDAYQIAAGPVPFGFEFLGKLTFRVVNLGQDQPEVHAFRLGGREVASGGFVLCPECGKVQGRRAARGEEEMKHDLTCRNRSKEVVPLRAVFLYRELHSEAIRILLPSTSADEDVAMSSFVSAVHLGLRLYFRGGIEHLRSCVDERPVTGTSLRRKYLVLYDQVPGGTGYLKELSQRPQTFLQVLRLACRHLESCECQTREDHDADGCHRCILQSRSRRDDGKLSRTTAIRLLTAILEHAGSLEHVTRVSDIDIHPLIKSELEKRFLDSLRSVPGAQLQTKIVRGKPGYLWRLGEVAWEIGLQVTVAADHSVTAPSIPDFVLYPVRAGVSRPVAVFLDGFAFHADEAAGRNRIAHDVMQRQALLKSGGFWVWNFSWEDLQHQDDPQKIGAADFGEARAEHRSQTARQFLTGGALELAQSARTLSSWQLFLAFLARPEADTWARIAQLYGLFLPLQMARADVDSAATILESLSGTGTEIAGPAANAQGDILAAAFTDHALSGLTVMADASAPDRTPGGLFLALRFNDDDGLLETEFPRQWRGFLRLLNRLQFLPNLWLLTVRGNKDGLFGGAVDALHYFLAGGQPPAAVVMQPAAAAAELLHPAVRTLAAAVRERTLPEPEPGFEWEEGGRIIAGAELAWPQRQIAVLDESAVADAEVFLQRQWRIFTFNTVGLSEAGADAILTLLTADS